MALKSIFSYRAPATDAGVFRPIPLKVGGRLYVSPMPFGAYDTKNRVLKLYRENGVQHVFMLVTDDEIKRKARRDLKGDYDKAGITWSQFAVQDMTAPDVVLMRRFVAIAVEQLRHKRVAVHCHAGVGRTSVFVCCVVQAVTGMSPEESIEYVKKHMELNVTTEQRSVVRRFVEES